MRSLLLTLFFIPFLAIAQKKQITIEDIYQKGTFRGEVVRGFESEDHSSLFDPKAILDEKGKAINTQDYQLSADKKRIIFFTGKEPIYRHSSKSSAYIYDVAT
ncbi:MAG TPA: hypothetical protein VEY32_04715, partial [Flavisolibacter sp.]|nr:hypothetical protein [Flavisolibacter sp.]